MREDTPAGGSLEHDQVLSQDAYGSDTDVTIGGATMPVPDLAVGRLVKTTEEIESHDRALPGPDRTRPCRSPATASLVTGYDFLADAANARQRASSSRRCPDGAHDALIDAISDTPTPTTSVERRPSWRASCSAATTTSVYLAGHFSANDTLAADFDTTLNAAAAGARRPSTPAS